MTETTQAMVEAACDAAALAAEQTRLAQRHLQDALGTGLEMTARHSALVVAKAAEAYAWSVFQATWLDWSGSADSQAAQFTEATG